MRSFFAFLLLLFVPLALIWLPVPGLAALIGGFVGGYVAARPGRAFLLALLPVVIIDALALLITTGLGLPVIGAVVAGAALDLLHRAQRGPDRWRHRRRFRRPEPPEHAPRHIPSRTGDELPLIPCAVHPATAEKPRLSRA